MGVWRVFWGCLSVIFGGVKGALVPSGWYLRCASACWLVFRAFPCGNSGCLADLEALRVGAVEDLARSAGGRLHAQGILVQIQRHELNLCVSRLEVLRDSRIRTVLT